MPALLRPQAVLFDLDDTLITAYRTPQRTWRAIIAEHAEALGEHDTRWVTAEVIDRVLAFLSDEEGRKLWRLEGDTTRRRVVRTAFHRLNLARPTSTAPLHGADADRIADRFETYLEETITLKDDAHLVLDRLRHAGLALGLLTNGQSGRQRAKLARFGLARHFDAIQIEEEAGFGKPEPLAYLTLLATLAAPPDRAWMVGDDLLWDIEAPAALGLTTVLLDESGTAAQTAPAHAVITRLADLPDLLSP
ncbi:HAD family hydrolase [Paracoccaceae bacterium Fryx2]|nr:HAD family hydrolase [Paracoccaceae bacterium Fryx2]